eukprot:scaffold76771_cov31-Tisochrysis_lutea.AAC.1
MDSGRSSPVAQCRPCETASPGVASRKQALHPDKKLCNVHHSCVEQRALAGAMAPAMPHSLGRPSSRTSRDAAKIQVEVE